MEIVCGGPQQLSRATVDSFLSNRGNSQACRLAASTRSSTASPRKGFRSGFLPRIQRHTFGRCGSKPTRRQSIISEVPDFIPSSLSRVRDDRPVGPSLEYSAEETVQVQLAALKGNDHPYPDHGVEVMYRFAGFDPFERSRYFGRKFDLGQFERFRRLFHHSSYRSLLGHKDARVLSSIQLGEHNFKQRVWIKGVRPGEEEVFEFTLVQRVGGSWDGYWFTDSLIHDGEGLNGNIAY